MVSVARSLRDHGVPVDVADFTGEARPHSRSIRYFKRLPWPDSDSSRFLAQIRDFIQQHGHDLVIPADDQALLALVQHYDDLNNLAHIACPPPPVTALVLNKLSTLEVARKCGLEIPKTKLISNSAELFESLSSFPLPWVLKPSSKQVRAEEVKSYTFRAVEDVKAAFPTTKDFTPPMLLQQYCSGFGVGVEVLMHKGKSVAVFQHRRLEEFPYSGGMSVTAMAEQPDPALIEKSVALLCALKWEGPAMVEFKVDGRNGEAFLMEVNGRYWGTISLPISVGVDFPLYHWQSVHGETPVVPDRYAVGTRWLWTTGYLMRLHGLLVAARRSRPARHEFQQSLMQFPAWLNRSTGHALFCASDPMPSVLELLRALKFLFVSDAKALFKRVAPRGRFR